MQLTAITKLNKKYKLSFDDDTKIYVSENTIIKFNLIKKMELTKEKIKEIQFFEYKEQAFLKALNYLSYSPKTEKDIIDYLKTKEIPEEIIEQTTKRLKELNYINDKEYALLYIKDRFESRKKGPHYITRKLKEKNIDDEYIKSSIEVVCSEEKIIDNVYEIIEKEYTKRKEPKTKKIQKITTKLYTNGYSFDIINKVFQIFFESFTDDISNENDELIEKYYNKAYDRISKKFEEKNILKKKIIEKLMRDGFSYDEIKNYLNKIDF